MEYETAEDTGWVYCHGMLSKQVGATYTFILIYKKEKAPLFTFGEKSVEGYTPSNGPDSYFWSLKEVRKWLIHSFLVDSFLTYLAFL